MGTSNSSIPRERIEYIDAMRGFTMLLVVFSHVESTGFFEYSYSSFIGNLFTTFRMPLFFFISGFVGYKFAEWNIQWYKGSLIKKLRVQLIPTFFFGLIYAYCYLGCDFQTFISNPAKHGYWFTLVLLEMFLVYYTVNFVVFHIKKANRNRVWIASLCCIAIIFYILKLPFKQAPTLRLIGDVTSLHYTFEFFQFFVFGIIASKYRDRFNRYLDNGYISGGFLLVFSILFYTKFRFIDINLTGGTDLWLILSTLIGDLCGYAGLVVVYATFRKYEGSLKSDTTWGKISQYVGRRTLDIYVLHYFFIPFLPQIGAFLHTEPNVVLELILGFSLSIAILVCCLAVSNIIRISNMLGYYLFGVKLRN